MDFAAQGIDSTIGEGGFGTVFRAKPMPEGCKLVAGTIRGQAALREHLRLFMKIALVEVRHF